MKSLTLLFCIIASYCVAEAQMSVAQFDPSPASGEASSEIRVPVNSYSPEESNLKSFGVSFFSLGGVNSEQFNRPDPSFYIYDGYLSFNFKTSRNLRFAARPAFNFSTAGNDYRGNEVNSKLQTRDFSLLTTSYNVLEDYLPATWDLKVQTRMYLPTSDGSKAQGMIARLRFEVETRYYYGKYSNLRSYVKPSYYFQRTTAYFEPFTNSTRTTDLGDVQYGSELDINLNKYFSIKPGFEFEDSWTNESKENSFDQRHTTTIAYRAGIEVRPMKTINFTIGYQDRRDLVNTGRDKDLSYSLMTNVRIY